MFVQRSSFCCLDNQTNCLNNQTKHSVIEGKLKNLICLVNRTKCLVIEAVCPVFKVFETNPICLNNRTICSAIEAVSISLNNRTKCLVVETNWVFGFQNQLFSVSIAQYLAIEVLLYLITQYKLKKTLAFVVSQVQVGHVWKIYQFLEVNTFNYKIPYLMNASITTYLLK